MTKDSRKAMRATRTALPFLTVGLLVSLPAWAQPQALPPQPQDSPGPAAQPENRVAPPPRLPPPARPGGYPYAYRQRPRLTEPEGPVTSWDPLRFAVALETRTTWLFDDAAKRLVGKRRSTGGGLSLQGDVFRPEEKLAVRLDLSWITTSGSSFQPDTGLSEKLESNLFTLGFSVRYHVFRWLAPFARLSGGMGWDKLTVADLHDRERFEQGSFGAGVFLRSPGLRLWQGAYSPLLGLVGNLEAGYSLATSSDFSLQSSPPSSSATPIPTNSVAIGTVGRSAPYVRASLGIAF